jgi:hypothetical protein
MRSGRLRRRLIPLSIASVLVPAAATVWLVVESDDFGRAPLPPAPRSADEPKAAAPDVALRLASGAELTVDDARSATRSAVARPDARYLALRKLEGTSPANAAEEAEAIVLSAADTEEGRFLAVNALAVLARKADGRPALLRCAERAPTAALREAAKTLLARRR